MPFNMPVRSLTSSVLKWPDQAQVDRAVRVWAIQEAKRHPELLRLGYFGSYASGNWGVGSDLDLVALIDKTSEPFERRSLQGLPPLATLQDAGPKPLCDETQNPSVGNPVRDHPQQPLVVHRVKEATDVSIEHPVHVSRVDPHRQRVQRLVRVTIGSEPIREVLEVGFIDAIENVDRCPLDDLVFQHRDTDRPFPSIPFGDVHPCNRLRFVRSAPQPIGAASHLWGSTATESARSSPRYRGATRGSSTPNRP